MFYATSMLQFSSKMNAMASTTRAFLEAHQTPFCGPSLPRAPDPETLGLQVSFAQNHKRGVHKSVNKTTGGRKDIYL